MHNLKMHAEAVSRQGRGWRIHKVDMAVEAKMWWQLGRFK